MPGMVLRSQPATLTATFTDTSGTVVDPGSVTVTVTVDDGTVIVAAAAASGTGAAARTYLLDSDDTADLDILTAAFTSASLGQTATDEVEVVGAQLFTIAEARLVDNAALAVEAEYSDDDIAAARERITEAFEERCEVSFIPRYRRAVVSGKGTCHLLLPDFGVYDVSRIEVRDGITWTAFTADELALVQTEPFGQLVLDSGVFVRGIRNYRVTYRRGWSSPPGEIRRAALRLLRNQIVPSNASDRHTSISSEAGTFTLATAGTQGNPWSAYRHYGLPEVDAVLRQYWRRLPRVD